MTASDSLLHHQAIQCSRSRILSPNIVTIDYDSEQRAAQNVVVENSQQIHPPQQSCDEKDRIIQELNQFVTQVESRMVEMQESIRILTSQLDKCDVAGSAYSPKSPHQQEEVHATTEDSRIQSLRETPADEYVSGTPESQLELIPDDLILNPQTLVRILDYSGQLLQSLMLWPFAIIHDNQEDRGVFCTHDKIFDALQSRDVGLVSKCLVWICLLLSQLPKDFKDAETGLPLCPEEFIDRILTQVSILYLADCTPACSIDSIEALVLQYELYIATGRPSRAWKCIRAGIENALLLGLHLRPSLVWDALWIRDRQISLIIGLPYGTLNMDVQATELDTEENRPGVRIAFPPIGHAIMRLYKHTLNIMIHLPYSQFAGYDKQFEYTRIEVLESAEGAIRAHRDIRSLLDKPLRCDLYDFLAFNAAVILVADLAAKETPRTMEEEERIWIVITEFVNRLRKTGEILENATAEQAADINLGLMGGEISSSHRHSPTPPTMACCTVCKKGEPEVTLKRCAKCSSESYCSRECQKNDWKQHKQVCGKGSSASAQATGGSGSPPKGLDQPIPDPFTRLDKGTYLHNRPEKDVYRLLIDCYRLRVEDVYNLEGEVMEDSLYSGAGDGLAGFEQFLDEMSTLKGLLPSWWTPEKQTECEEFGMNSSEQDLKTATDKADIIERYGDPQFPMQLRMLGEAVYGTAPGGGDGTAMRKMLASMESGGMDGITTMLDVSRSR
ncbi:unnamed protein product [Fusarium langsethiae]|nr:unnamed protein product [Fusarium langsethiae]